MDALEAYHRVAIAPDWQRIQALLRDDIAYRLQALADGGVDQMMRDLHPSVASPRRPERIVKYYEGHADLGGRGLLLVPCAFGVAGCPGADGTAERADGHLLAARPRPAVERHPAQAETALSDVLGRTRAALLSQLDLPMSTTQAATQLALSAPTLSVHLQALRAVGLLTSQREGRQVLYARDRARRSAPRGRPLTG